MRLPYGAGCFGAALLVALGACENATEPEPDVPPISLSIVSGDAQTGAVGSELPDVLVVRVTKQIGSRTIGVPLHLVNFRVLTGGGSVFAGSALTDLQGYAREYWMLGDEPGENTLEVRSVNPTTGEKKVFGSFTAFGVVPGPEVCNGLDDNLDGTVDDPSWAYCVGGATAPNTDGIVCDEGYLDLNATASDGCERLAAGRWTISPAITLKCSGLLGFDDATLTAADIEVVSPTRLSVKPDIRVGIFGNIFSRSLPPIPVDLGTGPLPETFAGSATFEFEGDLSESVAIEGDGSASIDGGFTGPTSLQATVGLTLDFTLRTGFPLPPLSIPVSCEDLNVTATATLGS